MKRILFFLLPLLYMAGNLSAQTTQAEIETFLTKEWIQHPVSSSTEQHTSGKCESGKSYIFSPEGKLEMRECKNQRMRTSKQNWTLNQSEYGDWQLIIGTDIYSLEMKTANGKETLALMPEPPEESEEKDEVETELAAISLYRLEPVAAGETDESEDEEPD